MLDKYRVSQIIALLNEGLGIETVARMTGVSRNTVRRFQRNIPRKGHHGRAWRAMEAKLEDIRKLFYDCRGNCSAMLSLWRTPSAWSRRACARCRSSARLFAWSSCRAG